MTIRGALIISVLLHLAPLGLGGRPERQGAPPGQASSPVPPSGITLQALLKPADRPGETHRPPAPAPLVETVERQPAPPPKQKAGAADQASAPVALYHARTALSRQPFVATNVDLSELSRMGYIQLPRVPLDLLINEEGRVDRVDHLPDILPDEVSARMVELLSQIRFTPGEIEGTPVKVRYRIEVIFP